MPRFPWPAQKAESCCRRLLIVMWRKSGGSSMNSGCRASRSCAAKTGAWLVAFFAAATAATPGFGLTLIGSSVTSAVVDNALQDGIGDTLISPFSSPGINNTLLSQTRVFAEFDISGLTSPVASASFVISFDTLSFGHVVNVFGKVGDGVATASADYTVGASLGSFTSTGSAGFTQIDITAFINGLISGGPHQWAEIQLAASNNANQQTILTSTPFLSIEESAAATPLPAALPLFTGGAGALGFFAWRRKKTVKLAS